MTIAALAAEAVRGQGFLPHAIINRSVDGLGRELGAELAVGHDDLDDFRSVTLILNHEMPFMLKHNRGHPADTATVYLPSYLTEVDEITKVISVIIDGLGLSADALRWQRAEDPDL
jgi:hypothetical protein